MKHFHTPITIDRLLELVSKTMFLSERVPSRRTTSVSRPVSVEYPQMIREGVVPMLPEVIPTLSCSPSKVNLRNGPLNMAQSPALKRSRVFENSCPVSFLVGYRWSFSVGLLEMVKCFLISFPFTSMVMNMCCPES